MAKLLRASATVGGGASQVELDLKAPLASPAFTGTPTGITAAHITSGALPVGVTGGSGLTALGTVASGTIGSGVTFPAGHVVQVLQYTNDYTAETTTTSEGDFEQSDTVAWEPSITVSSGNKVLILSTIQVATTISGENTRVSWRLYEKKGDASYALIKYDYRSIGLYDHGGDGIWMNQEHTSNYLSIPNTGDLIKYKITLQADDGSTIVTQNYPVGDGISNIILMEVTA
jgi:hypothetical protein